MSESVVVATTNTCATSGSSIRLVVQRYRSASILLDETKVIELGRAQQDLLQSPVVDDTATTSNDQPHMGMFVYVSFSKTAKPADVEKAAKTILNLPIHTEGGWGDGSVTKSIVQIALDARNAKNQQRVSLLIVPQANLIAKVKKMGKSIQYRDQIDKSTGEELYHCFVETVERLLYRESVGKSGSNTNNANTNNHTVDPSVPPNQYFVTLNEQSEQPLYASFDETTGLPVTNADGEPLTKSANKRIQKLLAAHTKKHEKWKKSKQQQATANENNKQDAVQETKPAAKLDPSFVQLVAGSFGKRQGLTLNSDMGPFCHVVDL